MAYADPKKDSTQWLTAVCLDLLEQNTAESKTVLISAIRTLVSYLEPGLIDQAFAPWIDQYTELLAQSENNQSSAQQEYLQADPLEPQGESETADE